MSNRGADRERAVIARYESAGWACVRAAGSHGPADFVALRPGRRAVLCQVKSDKAGPWAHFGPKDRDELRTFAKTAGADAMLCWWPPYGQITWIPPESWPR